jgi:hypothetical protein
MIKMPTPFEAAARHCQASAAAGGSTSSTTSSCSVVTLGVASIGTSMYFDSLKHLSHVKDISARESGPAADATGRAATGSIVLGFFLPFLALVIGVATGLTSESKALGITVALAFWVCMWTIAYRDGGRRRATSIFPAVVTFAVVYGLMVVELDLWFKH